MGREGGREGLREYMEGKSIVVSLPPAPGARRELV
jgi:hypothetical protein